MPKKAKRYHHGDLRDALVKTAIAALDRDPDAEITLRGLAKELGVSAMAPYAHFDGKDALLDAVAIEGFEALKTALDHAQGDAPDQVDREQVLLRLARTYVDLGLKRQGLYRAMFGRPAMPPGHPVRDAGERAFRPLQELFAESEKDRREGAEIAWSLIHGLTLLASIGFIQTGPVLDQRIVAACKALSHD
ncbi:MAG: TetR/AcrR family transcriptional regulator [Pseudomonadota bacterium]